MMGVSSERGQLLGEVGKVGREGAMQVNDATYDSLFMPFKGIKVTTWCHNFIEKKTLQVS